MSAESILGKRSIYVVDDMKGDEYNDLSAKQSRVEASTGGLDTTAAVAHKTVVLRGPTKAFKYFIVKESRWNCGGSQLHWSSGPTEEDWTVTYTKEYDSFLEMKRAFKQKFGSVLGLKKSDLLPGERIWRLNYSKECNSTYGKHHPWNSRTEYRVYTECKESIESK